MCPPHDFDPLHRERPPTLVIVVWVLCAAALGINAAVIAILCGAI